MSPKIMTLNIYMRIVCKKVPLKILCILVNLSFFYFPKCELFFYVTFLCTLLLYIYFYIFNIIFFGDIKIWGLIFLKSERKGISGARMPNTLSAGRLESWHNCSSSTFLRSAMDVFQLEIVMDAICKSLLWG
jgi:hypothetical protein